MIEGSTARTAAADRRGILPFFRGFLRHPATVASIVPSSRYLTSRIAAMARERGARTVVELGPGTGCTTRALLQVLARDARLLAIDVEDEFVSLLRCEDDPRLIAHLGSATMLREIVAQHGLPNPDLVVSGIPFSTMPSEDANVICEQIWKSLTPGGSFVAYQLRAHVAHYAEPWMGPAAARWEWLNIPPMRVYRWTKPAL